MLKFKLLVASLLCWGFISDKGLAQSNVDFYNEINIQTIVESEQPLSSYQDAPTEKNVLLEFERSFDDEDEGGNIQIFKIVHFDAENKYIDSHRWGKYRYEFFLANNSLYIGKDSGKEGSPRKVRAFSHSGKTLYAITILVYTI